MISGNTVVVKGSTSQPDSTGVESRGRRVRMVQNGRTVQTKK